MVTNPEKEHMHNINRLVQEFGKNNKSEINKLYLLNKEKIENKNIFLPYAIPLETYEKTRENLYFFNTDKTPPECFLSEDYL